LREIARELKVTHPTVRRWLDKGGVPRNINDVRLLWLKTYFSRDELRGFTVEEYMGLLKMRSISAVRRFLNEKRVPHLQARTRVTQKEVALARNLVQDYISLQGEDEVVGPYLQRYGRGEGCGATAVEALAMLRHITYWG
jgi:hypothetical protein